MATVTGYTAARMKIIEDSSIVGGTIDGDDLVLTRFDSTEIIAGDVRGPIGPVGPDGNPPGTFIIGGWTTDPAGYLILDGATVTGGASTYPNLAAIFPGWVSGGNLVLPNAAGAVPMVSAGTKGVVSGAMSHTITANNLPVHTHPINHTHATPAGVNFPNISALDGSLAVPNSGSFGSANTATPAFVGASGNNTTAATAFDHTPKNITVKMAVKF